MKVVHCPCGETIEGETDEEVVAKVNAHLEEVHQMGGTYTDEQILSMAHEH